MTIYYQDDRVTLYHGDCREVLAGMADESVAAMLTDPPYTERTHRNAKANDSTKGYAVRSVTFASISDAVDAAATPWDRRAKSRRPCPHLTSKPRTTVRQVREP